MNKTHKHDIVLAVIFFAILVGVGIFFATNALTGTKAAPSRQAVEQKILECYKKQKPDICPDTPPDRGTQDKNLKVCGMCYSRCMICIAARYIGGQNCEAKCAQDNNTPEPTSAAEPSATPVPGT